MPGLIAWKINAYLEVGVITLVPCFGEAIPALGPIHRFCTMHLQNNSGATDSGHSFFIHSFYIFFSQASAEG